MKSIAPFEAATVVILYCGGCPILMKTPSGLSALAFVNGDVGAKYLTMSGKFAAMFSFESVASVLAWMSPEKILSHRLILFQSEEELKLFLDDPARFPYGEFEVSLATFDGHAQESVQPGKRSAWWRFW